MTTDTAAATTARVEDVEGKTFDYVICGGGTAGLCLAARLSEDAGKSVLVLEAGDANLHDPEILRPASYGSHFGKKSYDWAFKTVKQKFCGGKEYGWQRGKGLGGSSAINFMCWIKPPATDIDDFEKLGNPGWNWSSVQSCINRAESFVYLDPETEKADGAAQKNTGPLLTAFPGKIIEAELEIQQTLINRGIPVAPDPLGGKPNGVYFAANTVDPKTHTRTYAVTAFYIPNAHRTNLHVLCGAHVHRVNTESAGKDGALRATEVEFEYGGRVRRVSAGREVVLSAGALKTPHILEMSGIGVSSVLKSIGVPGKLDLPVGENVQEHLFLGVSWELRPDVSFDTLDILHDPEVAAKHVELHKKGEGMFTTGIVGFAFTELGQLSVRAGAIYEKAKARVEANKARYPPGLSEQYEIQLERLRSGVGCELITVPGLMSGPNTPEKGKKYYTMLAAANHCFSRGTIHSTTSDPAVDPAYDPQYFQEDVDLQILLEMIKFIRELPKTAPLKDMVVAETNPGPNVVSDDDLCEWIKQTMSTTYHTASSAAMLPKDKGGVVDSTLKVYGTSNLRVVDMSIVPLHFAAHPQATVYGIAEKAAEIIKAVAA